MSYDDAWFNPRLTAQIQAINDGLSCGRCGHPLNYVSPHRLPLVLTCSPLWKCSCPCWKHEQVAKRGTTAPGAQRSPILSYHYLLPAFLTAMAEVMTEGGKHRGEDPEAPAPCWQRGQTTRSISNHAMKHLLMLMANERHGKPMDRAERRRQWAKLACNAMMGWWYERHNLAPTAGEES